MSTYSPEHLMDGPPGGTPELVNEAGQLVGPHECQNQCGRRAAYVLVDIDEGRADIICGLCLMAMMAAVAEQVPPPGLVANDDNAAAGA